MHLTAVRPRWKGYAAIGLGLIALAGSARARRTRRRPRLKFDFRYREQVQLRDGTRALIRLVRPGDKPLLRAGMKRLSPEGRYRRFHVPKSDLSAAELRYLTEIDSFDHFAIGAIRLSGNREGLGVARFVRLADRPDTAEFAISVADEVQGNGLGKLLLARLAESARERGIRTLTCDALATNRPLLRLLDSLFPQQSRRYEGATVTVEARLKSSSTP